MKKFKIKVTVLADATACAEMRIKFKDSEWSEGVTGIDLVDFLLVARNPKVYGNTFLNLAKEVAIVKHYMAPRFICSEFEDLENIAEIYFRDDTEATVPMPAFDAPYKDIEKYHDTVASKREMNRSEFLARKDRLLHSMTLNDEGDWVGYIEVCI